MEVAETDAQRRARRATVNILGLEWKKEEREDVLLFPLAFVHPDTHDLQLRLRLLGPLIQTSLTQSWV